MEKKKNKTIFLIITIILIFSLIVIGFMLLKPNKKDPNINTNNRENIEEELYKTNNNENVLKDQEVDKFKFTNTSLNYIEGNSVLRVSVTNITNEDVTLQEFKIHVYDKDKNELVTLTGFVGDKILAEETKFIECSYADDLTNAEFIEYEIIY